MVLCRAEEPTRDGATENWGACREVASIFKNTLQSQFEPRLAVRLAGCAFVVKPTQEARLTSFIEHHDGRGAARAECLGKKTVLVAHDG